MIKHYWPLALLIAGAFGIFSCNKNSNELAPIGKGTLVVPKPVEINGRERFKVFFEQNKYSKTDTVDVYVENTGQDSTGQIDSATILVEVCSSNVSSYNGCKLSPLLTFRALKGGKRIKVFSFYDEQINLDANNLHIGVIKFDTFTKAYSGYYAQPGTTAAYSQDTQYKYTSKARGYVTYDGTSIFHLNAADTAQYEINGGFTSDSGFNGTISSGNTTIATLKPIITRDTAGQASAFKFNNGVLTTSFTLTHGLHDNVNQIALQLIK